MEGVRQYLGRKLSLDILHLAPQHEGLQDLMQTVDDHHTLLHGNIVLASSSWSGLAKAVPKPFGKLVLIIKHLQGTARSSSSC